MSTYTVGQARRSLADKLRTKINGTFRRAGNSAYYVDPDQETLAPSLSGFDSECSTLVDYSLDDDDLIEAPSYTEATALFDRMGRSSRDSLPPSYRSIQTAELLDEEDCAWGRPRPMSGPSATAAMLGKLTAFTKSPKSRSATRDPEYLDAENCAWSR